MYALLTPCPFNFTIQLSNSPVCKSISAKNYLHAKQLMEIKQYVTQNKPLTQEHVWQVQQIQAGLLPMQSDLLLLCCVL